jgi:hypothetical protein
MLISTDHLQQRLIPFLPKIGAPIVKAQLDAAAREFFSRAQVWVAEVPIDAVADQAEYVIDLEDVGNGLFAQEILWLESADEQFIQKSNYTYDGTTLTFVSALVPAESEVAAWTARVHIACLDNCVEFPDDLLLKFGDAVVGRAFELLAEPPGTPWFNPKLAERGRKDFLRGIQRAKIAIEPEGISG